MIALGRPPERSWRAGRRVPRSCESERDDRSGDVPQASGRELRLSSWHSWVYLRASYTLSTSRTCRMVHLARHGRWRPWPAEVRPAATDQGYSGVEPGAVNLAPGLEEAALVPQPIPDH